MLIHGHRTGSILQLAERLQDCDVALRWGGPHVAGAINGQVRLLDGLEQLTVLKGFDVPVPEFLNVAEYRARPVDFDGVWLARKANHTQGKDIIPVGVRIRGRRRWINSDYFVKYEPNVAREWRFHILNGQSIARGLKVWAGTGPEPTQHPIIRSRRLGWYMRHDVKPPDAMRELAKAAVAAVGYDLGAVDLLELTDGTGMVLEINSRPAIRDEYTLSRYEKTFRNL